MEQIIKAILKKLQEVKELKFIDVNFGQLTLENPAVDFPCALIDVEHIDYSSTSGKAQIAEAYINVTLAFKIYAPTSAGTPEAQQELGLQHYEIIKKVSSTLHNWGESPFSRLCRTSIKRNDKTFPENYTLNFKCQYTD
ncbi:MAG: hypothetical protein IMY73_02270 [Bacteroidetes bacterium]|nr:hypothetical protein [Bacteroidota bacterium]